MSSKQVALTFKTSILALISKQRLSNNKYLSLNLIKTNVTLQHVNPSWSNVTYI